jgi:hypothetical protein
VVANHQSSRHQGPINSGCVVDRLLLLTRGRAPSMLLVVLMAAYQPLQYAAPYTAACSTVYGGGGKHMTRTGASCVSALVAFLVLVLPSTIVAVGASSEQLRPVIEWVQTEGAPSKINGRIAEGLGIRTRNEDGALTALPIIHKAFRLENGIVYSFGLAMINGRREVIMEHYTATEYRGWRMGEDGVISKTVAVSSAREITKNDGFTFEKEFDSVLDFFISRTSAAKSK